MSTISWIQLASRMVENTAAPLDAKMQLSTADRLDLSTTQRWIGMIVYDTDLNLWKTLITDWWWASTVEWDWINLTHDPLTLEQWTWYSDETYLYVVYWADENWISNRNTRDLQESKTTWTQTWIKPTDLITIQWLTYN